ncbi:hypothetical protein DXG01_011716 [Tephrocybe rancida]|nr:hypothetical protein DXG01_011716 [Tephrocybe rancida]
MSFSVVSLPTSTSTEYLEALAEVSNFGLTDMGCAGQGPWTYRILTETLLDEELARMSGAKSYPCGIDVVSLQPCLSYTSRSQDRYVIQEWYLPDGKWIFSAVLDGHLNHATVDFVARELPAVVKDALCNSATEELLLDPGHVSKLLTSAIQKVDDGITSRFMNLLSKAELEAPSVPSIPFRDAENEVIAQSLGGTTVILCLTDSRGRLWVANLGVLGHRRGEAWSGFQINSVHHLNVPEELSRVTRDHPGEPNVTKDGRVLGFLEPTRAVGDTWLKLPATYASLVRENTNQSCISPNQLHRYAERILTPPYVSNIPEVYHFVPDLPYFVLLGSDGFLSTERYNGMDATEVVERWINISGHVLDSRRMETVNCALYLLRDMLGGDDIDMVSRNLTVEMEERWMDDTTILMQKVGNV